MRYGLPYSGSKSRIAQDIINLLPPGDRLIDLFAGGCAITHCALLSGKWRRVLANDIAAEMPQLFKDAAEGKYADEKRWVSREDFFAGKDPLARVVFSFGGDRATYLYGRKVEPLKRACHFAVVFDDWEPFSQLCPKVYVAARRALDCMPSGTWKERRERRLRLLSVLNEDGGRLQLESMPRLERLQELEGLPNLERLELSGTSYDAVPISPGDVVYADPPYNGTKGYGCDFDHERFWRWVASRDYPVYVSEYTAPEGFAEVYSKPLQRLACGGVDGISKATEKVFVHRRFAEGYDKR